MPFFRIVALPISCLAFAGASADALLTQVLPRYSRSASGLGVFFCMLDNLAGGQLGAHHTPGFDVSVQEGSGCVSTKAGTSVQLRWTTADMRGWRPHMEDGSIATVLQHSAGELGLFAVFDGHGGSEVSAVLQAVTAQWLAARLNALSAGHTVKELGNVLTETVEALDQALCEGPLGMGHWLGLSYLHPFRSTGSTSCIALVDAVNQQIVVANTGDSRAILCRAGQAVPLSEDHKPEDPKEFSRICGAGGFIVRTGPCFRVDGGLNLSRALGDFKYKANSSLPPRAQRVIATPDIMVQAWAPHDQDEFLVVACDGLFERMSRQNVVDHIRAGLASGMKPAEVLRSLLRACCARSPMEAGQDNETVILVQWSRTVEAKT